MFLATISETDIASMVKPIEDIINITVPILLGLVCSIGAIYCIILGVKFARADDPQEHEKAKKSLIYAIVGFLLIFVLLIALHFGTLAFTDYYKNSIA